MNACSPFSLKMAHDGHSDSDARRHPWPSVRAGPDGPGSEVKVLLSGLIRAWIPLLCDGHMERMMDYEMTRRW